MANPTLQIEPVLRAYDNRYQPLRVDSLGSSGGYSGARFWRLFTTSATLCLRRWPADHPTAERLSLLHEILQTTYEAGFTIIPLPIRARTGETFISEAGHLWELTLWLPGAADYHAHPSQARLTAALQALANFHRAAARHRSTPPFSQVSPSLMERITQLAKLRDGQLARIQAAVTATSVPLFDALAHDVMNRFVLAAERVSHRLAIAARRPIPLQPVIRDIWHDHVLFSGATVTGLIDFGAMRIDTVAADISRLLGSLVADDARAWEAGLTFYEAVRPLSADERALIPVFDETSVLLSGMNWLSWLYLDRRHFEDPSAVQSRLVDIVGRLDMLVRRNPLT